MRQVAERARVDPSVVSRLLSADPKLSVSAATRARVLEVVEELGYRPNPAAQALRTSRNRLVAVLLPDLANPVYAELMHGIQTRAAAAGYGIVIAETHHLDHAHDPSDLVHRVDGLLVAAGTFAAAGMRRFAGLPIPVVVMNRQAKGASASIVINDKEGSRLVADHLYDLGHRDIVVMLGSGRDGVGGARLAAFRDRNDPRGGRTSALAAEGFTARDGYEAASAFFADRGPATAMYTVNFMLGIGALRAAQEQGVRVPEDFSIAALHESELAAYTSPSLTTVQMPMTEVGSRAFECLLGVLDGTDRGGLQKVTTAPVLLPRESTGPAPAG